jgi:hypothetical protein
LIADCSIFLKKIPWVNKGNQYKQWSFLIHLGNGKQCPTIGVGQIQTDTEVVENSISF